MYISSSSNHTIGGEFFPYKKSEKAEVVCIHDYTDDEIIEKGNELLLIMFVNKLKKSEDIRNLKDQILERKIPMLFDNFEAYDAQETRRVSEIWSGNQSNN